MRNAKQITRARSKGRPTNAKLSQEQREAIHESILCGASYYAAGKKQGVSGATARYWFKRWLDAKIPLRVVLRGLMDASESKGRTLLYYKQPVEQEALRVSRAMGL